MCLIFMKKKSFDSVLSLKAETHNFPTTVEPFNGAATAVPPDRAVFAGRRDCAGFAREDFSARATGISCP